MNPFREWYRQAHEKIMRDFAMSSGFGTIAGVTGATRAIAAAGSDEDDRPLESFIQEALDEVLEQSQRTPVIEARPVPAITNGVHSNGMPVKRGPGRPRKHPRPEEPRSEGES